MHVEVFADAGVDMTPLGGEAGIRSVLGAVAEGTNHDKLVVAVYLLDDATTWRGVMYNAALAPRAFCNSGRTWSFVTRFETPTALPARYGLIRMAFGAHAPHPRIQTCRYGWEYVFESFRHSLALMFAHELHHYRRHHLGLHPRGGEQSAIKWSLVRTREAGFPVEARRTKCRAKSRRKPDGVPTGTNPSLLGTCKRLITGLSVQDLQALQGWIDSRILSAEDAERQRRHHEHYAHLRSASAGTRLHISRKAPDERAGQPVSKVRNLRGSENMLVSTDAGVTLRCPMVWLEEVGTSEC